MIDKVSINFLIHKHERKHFLRGILYFLSKVKDENKELLRINFLVSDHSLASYVEKMIREIDNFVMDCNIIVFQGGLNYPDKVECMISQDCKYTVKWDEDFFVNNYALDYMIENRKILDDPKNLAFAPLSSTGIPTSELFVNSFFDSKDIKELHEEILRVNFPNIWGYDYSHLNEFTVGSETWNGDLFYESTNKINYHYKGINPYRVGSKLQNLINQKILKNTSKFLEKNDYNQVILNRYCCNHMVMILTEDYRKIVEDKSLFVDPFEEVPLNEYRNRNNLNFIFVEGAFGIHTMYNTIYDQDNNVQNEQDFYNGLEKIIMEKTN